METQVRGFLANLESQLAYSPSTRLAYENDLRCFIEYLKSSLDRPPNLEDFSARQAASFLEAERQAGRRPSTLLRRRASLRRFVIYLRQETPEWAGKFDQEAYLIDAAISIASPAQKPRFLSAEQIDSLRAVLEASPRPRARRDQAILALLLECGLTVGTLIALNLPDLDLHTGRLHLCLENGQDIWIPLGEAEVALQRYLKEGRPELNCRQGEIALFISQTGGRMSRQGVWQVLRQWGSKAGLPLTLSPRLARHTAAVHLERAGRSLADIQALLGHSNPLSTQALLRRLETAGEEEQEETEA